MIASILLMNLRLNEGAMSSDCVIFVGLKELS